MEKARVCGHFANLRGTDIDIIEGEAVFASPKDRPPSGQNFKERRSFD